MSARFSRAPVTAASRYVLALAMVLLSSASVALCVPELTARDVFWRLPATVFEGTVDGLSERDKYELLTRGFTEHWVIRAATPDTLELESLRDKDVSVLLRLFRNSETTVAAIGTDSGPVCITELWRLGSRSRATPMLAPPEPHLLDFFTPGKRIPPGLTASMPFCVRQEGLEVRPLFWTSTGVADVKPDNAVFYVWDGDHFSKRIIPLPRSPFPGPSGE